MTNKEKAVIREEAEGWMKRAEKDLSDAKFNLNHRKFEVAAFLSHQAAEKALKSLHILKFNKLLKIHDLVELGKKVGAEEEILKACDKLNPFYIETRYIINMSYKKEIVSDGFMNSKRVLKWAKKLLKK